MGKCLCVNLELFCFFQIDNVVFAQNERCGIPIDFGHKVILVDEGYVVAHKVGGDFLGLPHRMHSLNGACDLRKIYGHLRHGSILLEQIFQSFLVISQILRNAKGIGEKRMLFQRKRILPPDKSEQFPKSKDYFSLWG